MGDAEVLSAYMEQYARNSKKEKIEHELAMNKLEAIQEYMELNGVTEIDTQYGSITLVPQEPRWSGTPDLAQLVMEFPNVETVSVRAAVVEIKLDEETVVGCPGDGRHAFASPREAWDSIIGLGYTEEEKARIRVLLGLIQPDDKVVIRQIEDPENPPENWPYDDE